MNDEQRYRQVILPDDRQDRHWLVVAVHAVGDCLQYQIYDDLQEHHRRLGVRYLTDEDERIATAALSATEIAQFVGNVEDLCSAIIDKLIKRAVPAEDMQVVRKVAARLRLGPVECELFGGPHDGSRITPETVQDNCPADLLELPRGRGSDDTVIYRRDRLDPDTMRWRYHLA